MDSVLAKYYINNKWCCGKTYESLEWYDTTREKPTEEELNMKWEELKKDKMRTERNQLLKDCDFVMLPDFPHTSEEMKNEWIQYRGELRDFPATWSDGKPFPEKP